jgi:hypothetical protein
MYISKLLAWMARGLDSQGGKSTRKDNTRLLRAYFRSLIRHADCACDSRVVCSPYQASTWPDWLWPVE